MHFMLACVLFAVGAIIGSFGGAAIVYPPIVTLRVFKRAKKQGLIDRIPLSPIIVSPLLWILIITVVTLLLLRFTTNTVAAYFVGFLITFVMVLGNINNPVNEQEIIETNNKYFTRQSRKGDKK